MTPPPSTNPLRLALAPLALFAAQGCVERKILVTSDPPGALVYLNDVQIGLTPAEARFTFYGTYDVRLELDGHETLSQGRKASAPFWQYPGLDLVAYALPLRLVDVQDWHFTLQPDPAQPDPAQPVTDERAALIDRAEQIRRALDPSAQPPPTVPQQPAPPPPPGL